MVFLRFVYVFRIKFYLYVETLTGGHSYGRFAGDVACGARGDTYINGTDIKK
jgi:hypothetical protein